MRLNSFFAARAGAVAICFGVAVLGGLKGQTPNDRPWLEREPLRHEYNQASRSAAPVGQPADPYHPDVAYMQPPDPNSQIPLTGFDWMLLGSFAFGAWWLVRHRELLAARSE
jgi:hypothetical protein